LATIIASRRVINDDRGGPLRTPPAAPTIAPPTVTTMFVAR
jgi:hypothetical protein